MNIEDPIATKSELRLLIVSHIDNANGEWSAGINERRRWLLTI